jgi:hypothetical protein
MLSYDVIADARNRGESFFSDGMHRRSRFSSVVLGMLLGYMYRDRFVPCTRGPAGTGKPVDCFPLPRSSFRSSHVSSRFLSPNRLFVPEKLLAPSMPQPGLSNNWKAGSSDVHPG